MGSFRVSVTCSFFFLAFLFGLLDWMVFIRHPAHVRWQGFPWPQGERQPIVKVRPAALFLNTKPLNFASCTCPNYWSGYFALEQSRPRSVRPTEKWVDKLQQAFFNKVPRGKWVNFLCYMWGLLTLFKKMFANEDDTRKRNRKWRQWLLNDRRLI